MPARISMATKVREAARDRVRSYGNPAAERFGEGARPGDSEILRVVLGVVTRHPDVEREIARELIRSRIQDGA